MAKNKTEYTGQNVNDFINSVEQEQKRKDSFELLKIMEELTGEKPKMFGPTIIGFGEYFYKYASGHEGTAPLLGFSPRKAAISLYIYSGQKTELLEKLGKFKMGKVCIYVNKLSDISLDVMKELSLESIKITETHYKRI